MNIDSYNNLYLICIEAPLTSLYDFVAKDSALESFHKEMSYREVSLFYKNAFYNKSEKSSFSSFFSLFSFISCVIIRPFLSKRYVSILANVSSISSE